MLHKRFSWYKGLRLWKSYSTYVSFREGYEHKLPEFAITGLAKLGVTHPNELQRKCLDPLLDADYNAAVINAETGSGKTYCFLLPIIKLFADIWKVHGNIPSLSALILVPTPHLGYQIESVYRSLARSEWGSCVAHNSSRLLLKSTTSLVIATPTTLVQYDLNRVLKRVQLTCVDEADVLLTGSERESTWNILDTVRNLSAKNTELTPLRDTVDLDSTQVVDTKRQISTPTTRYQLEGLLNTKQQFIFTAATLPSGGRQTVQSRLKKWLPENTLYITTGHTHQLLPTAEMRFIDVGALGANNKLTPAKQKQLIVDLHELQDQGQQNLPKVLIFCNSVASAENVYSFLTKSVSHLMTSELCTLTPPWWTGKIGQLFKRDSTSIDDIEDTLKLFKSGEKNVLIASDLGCRGLDLQDVTSVIQCDFPGNVADFLHRAGRTARAGKSGVVISYVDQRSRDVACEIRKLITEGESLETLFSRNKMLRRKMKRKKKMTG